MSDTVLKSRLKTSIAIFTILAIFLYCLMLLVVTALDANIKTWIDQLVPLKQQQQQRWA